MFLGHELLRHGLLDEAAMEMAARKILADLHVTTVRSIRQPVASLSGGQRQSVAVAKAVHVDGQARDHGRAHRGARRGADPDGARPDQTAVDQGIAVLVISHNLNDVFEVADRIAVLYLGRDGGRRTSVGVRQPGGGRLHDHGRVVPDGSGVTGR